MRKTVLILSGGMDSSTLAYQLKAERDHVKCISFNYGQRHLRELRAAENISRFLNLDFELININSLQRILGGSALTDNLNVPDGAYSKENMDQTIVSNRNAIFISIAWAYAINQGAERVALALHSGNGNHPLYPDCTPPFVEAITTAMLTGTKGYHHPNLSLYTPYLDMTKAQIAKLGQKLKVPYEETWTCYKGDTLHCGQCAACHERQEAFCIARVPDPTRYKTPFAFDQKQLEALRLGREVQPIQKS